MIGLLQRVTQAEVVVMGQAVGVIGHGLLVLVGIEKGDTHYTADYLLGRILSYRVFPDDSGKMNLSLSDVRGGLLLVPQFTLAADTKTGTRPSFTPAATPKIGEELFRYLVNRARACHPIVECGHFGSNQQVSLTNDGPVTFWLRVEPKSSLSNETLPEPSH